MRVLDALPDTAGPSVRLSQPPVENRLLEDWPHVHIDNVETQLADHPGEHAAADRPDEHAANVRADVDLGGLLPADVRVELAPGEPSPDDQRMTPSRLWSTHSYHNGRYAFEASVPAGVLERAGGCVVTVSPAAGVGDSVAVDPAVAAVAPPKQEPLR